MFKNIINIFFKLYQDKEDKNRERKIKDLYFLHVNRLKEYHNLPDDMIWDYETFKKNVLESRLFEL